VNPVIIGQINGLHGVQGWVKVYSYTRPRERILAYSPWLIERDGQWQSLQMLEGKAHGSTIIARLHGCTERAAAQCLVGAALAVDRAKLPPPDAGEYYWVDLIGLRVITVTGGELGTVQRLLETGANDVLVVHGPDGELLIPFVEQVYVREIDFHDGCITVEWTSEG